MDASKSAAVETSTLFVNGMDMHFESRGEGEPLVLLHGFTGSGGDWTHVFDLNALARRHRVIVPDMRGHGGSTNPAGSFTHRQCAEDVRALLDRLGVGRYRAVGMSLGGNTLLHLATRERDRVAAMVVVSATMYYPSEARAFMRSTTEDTQTPEEWARMRGTHRHGDAQIRALWGHARAFADSYDDDMCFTPPHLALVGAPTLIVTGDRDPLYPVTMAVEMYRAIPGAALNIVAGGGHVPIFAGDQRTDFVREAVRFVEGVPL